MLGRVQNSSGSGTALRTNFGFRFYRVCTFQESSGLGLSFGFIEFLWFDNATKNSIFDFIFQILPKFFSNFTTRKVKEYWLENLKYNLKI